MTCHICNQQIGPTESFGRIHGGGIYHTACQTTANRPPPIRACRAIDKDAEDAAQPHPPPNPQNDPEARLSIKQAAQLLGLSPATIRARIRAGHLPADRLRHTQTIRLRRADILNQLEPFPTE